LSSFLPEIGLSTEIELEAITGVETLMGRGLGRFRILAGGRTGTFNGRDGCAP
jgi:hypothetical protein